MRRCHLDFVGLRRGKQFSAKERFGAAGALVTMVLSQLKPVFSRHL